MSIRPTALALLAASLFATLAAPALAAGDKPAKPPVSRKDKAAADKAAAEKAAADKADAEKAAADKEAADKAAAEKAAADKADADKATADKATADKAAADKAAAEAVDPNDPSEDPGKTYRFIGLRYRDAVIPTFMLHLFAAGGRTVNVPMVGPEFISRRDHLEYGLAVMYADYSMGQTIFRSKTNPPTSNELVASTLKQIFVTLDIQYEIPLEKKGEKTGRVALLIGGGVGLGGIFGDLYRSQAYPLKSGPADDNVPSQWGVCHAYAKGGGYCGTDNGHFSPGNDITKGYAEPSWAHGGSKPLLFPWLALPQVSLRFKPIKQFQSKVDLGFSTTGFYFGFSGSYGL
jgi:hypothetical protein